MKNPSSKVIYMDNAATTVVDPAVVGAITHFYTNNYANPSAVHPMGIEARKEIQDGRFRLSQMTGIEPNGVIFTSGGTEANNLAILGFPPNRKRKGNHILFSAIEHPSVIEPCRELERRGYEVQSIPVLSTGQIDEKALMSLLRDETILVCLMHANNEIGTVFPIAELSKIVRQKSPHAHIHMDAVQTFGKLKVNLRELDIDSAAISGHKFHGPKGIGALFHRSKTPPTPLFRGGGQEAGLRSGTENVPGIVGLAKAAEIAEHQRVQEHSRLSQLRKQFHDQLVTSMDDVVVHGDPEHVLPTVFSIAIMGCPAEALLHHLETKNIFVSAGSACHSKKSQSSHVLKAIGATDPQINSTLRFSFSRQTTAKDFQKACEVLPQVVQEMRAMGL